MCYFSATKGESAIEIWHDDLTCKIKMVKREIGGAFRKAGAQHRTYDIKTELFDIPGFDNWLSYTS